MDGAGLFYQEKTEGVMELKEAREVISAIDEKMAELFEKRMEAVKEVAEYKSGRGLPIEDRERELNLIDRMSEKIKDDLIRPYYVNFLQSTMDISKNWQRRLLNGIKVACAEERYYNGRSASELIFPNGDINSYEQFEDAYRAVSKGDCDVAVLPLENSDRGEVGKVYDLIFTGSLHVNNIKAVEADGSTTRYAILSRSGNEEDLQGDSESYLIMFTVKDEVGGLAKAINVISAYGYNMRVLRSRPMKDLPWHYYFHAELEGKRSPGSTDRIIRGLTAACPEVKIAGHFIDDNEVIKGRSVK